jgi:hypothetical protein
VLRTFDVIRIVWVFCWWKFFEVEDFLREIEKIFLKMFGFEEI